MDGLEAARQIARIDPNTTIVMFTLRHCKQVVQDAKAAGIGHVVSKMGGGPADLLALPNDISVSKLLP